VREARRLAWSGRLAGVGKYFHMQVTGRAAKAKRFRKRRRREPMPLVRIDLQKGKDTAYRQKAGQIVYQAMVACTGVPPNDHFQIIGEHSADNFIFDPDYLGIHRTNDLIMVQIFFNEGRSVAQKQALYKAIAEGLSASLQVRPEDVFITLVEVRKENWSFGNGVAQYAS
jgi:phenylpyruvate tautomerase PptA (4-oxalocrotonate tautomerase family)